LRAKVCVGKDRPGDPVPEGPKTEVGVEAQIELGKLGIGYVSDLVDRHCGPMIADVTGLAFCDARGLATLARVAGYAEQKGCPFRLASPRPLLVKIMRITGLDQKLRTCR
jgi:STAS domain